MNIVSPKTMWSLIILVSVSSFFIFDHEYLYVPDVFSKFVFIVCVLFWLTLICSAFFVHHEAYKNSYATSRVVTEGIYRKMKHPMYVGDIVLFIGISFLFPMMWVFVVAFFGILIFLWFMKIENNVLEERFGSSLGVYRESKTKKVEVVSQKQKMTKKKKVVYEEGVTKKERKPRVSKSRTKKETTIIEA